MTDSHPKPPIPIDATLDLPTTAAGAAAGSSSAPAIGSLREGPGSKIGPYKLLQLMGEGGFGSVFMAEQERPVQRKVALKIIKLGMDTHQVVARFEQERQALAVLDHPHIAKVFDAGATETGRPYFVMELCTGEPIDSYCDKNKLSIAERLRLFSQVCHAVQHAHMKGIIHRDLKPSNVLVSVQDGKPSTKVIDFGIAKATASRLTEKTVFTEEKQIIGTPEYMSPEQAEGSLDIDTRTDVYALGVMLYELLTGSTPFSSKELRSAAYAEIQRIIREVEPPKPSTRLSQNTDTIASVAAHRQTEPRRLGTMVRGELDWIVMKALEKDRTRRYETANSLMMDVQRFLGGEAVQAAPPSTVYRIRKFIRRNRLLVTAGSLVAAALVIATGVSVLFGMSEARQRIQTEIQRAEAVKQQGIAETNAALELKARKRAEAINTFVTTALKASDADYSTIEAPSAAHDMTILAAMDNAIKDIDSGRFKDDPETEAALRDTIGVIFRDNGRYDKAGPLLEHALTMRERLFKGDDRRVAESLSNLAWLYQNQDKYAEAESLFKRALEIDEKSLGADSAEVATNLNNLALATKAQGKLDQAELLFTRALAIREKTPDSDQFDFAAVQINLAMLYLAQGKYALAEPLLTQALEKFEKVRGPGHPSVAQSLTNLGSLHVVRRQYSQAVPLYTRALEIFEKSYGPDHPAVAVSLGGLADIYRAQGDLSQAEPLYLRALAINEKSYGPDHRSVASSVSGLASIYRTQRKLAQAEPLYLRALAITEKALGPDHPDTLTCKGSLAAMYWSATKFDQSIPLFEAVVKAQEATLGRQHPQTLLNVANLGVNYKDAGRIAEALPLLEEAYHFSKEYPHLQFAEPQLLDAFTKAADPANSEKVNSESIDKVATLMQEMLAARREKAPDDQTALAGQLAQFSQTLLGLKAWEKAEPLLREALAIREKTQPDAWTTFNTKSMLGGAIMSQNRLADAEPLLLAGYQGMTDREATVPLQGKVRITEALERLIKLYEAKGNQAEAATWRSKLEAKKAE